MVPSDASHVTALLAGWREGDEEAGRELVEVVYRELRRVASAHLRSEPVEQPYGSCRLGGCHDRPAVR